MQGVPVGSEDSRICGAGVRGVSVFGFSFFGQNVGGVSETVGMNFFTDLDRRLGALVRLLPGDASVHTLGAAVSLLSDDEVVQLAEAAAQARQMLEQVSLAASASSARARAASAGTRGSRSRRGIAPRRR